MSREWNRTYLHYNDENIGAPIILAFRSEESLNKHISRLGIQNNNITEITNKIPINPNLSHLEVNRILQSVGYQDISLSQDKGGVRNRSVHV